MRFIFDHKFITLKRYYKTTSLRLCIFHHCRQRRTERWNRHRAMEQIERATREVQRATAADALRNLNAANNQPGVALGGAQMARPSLPPALPGPWGPGAGPGLHGGAPANPPPPPPPGPPPPPIPGAILVRQPQAPDQQVRIGRVWTKYISLALSDKVGYFLSVRILLIQAQRNTGGNVDDVNRNANPRQGQGLDLADDMADINNLLQDIQDVEAEWNME